MNPMLREQLADILAEEIALQKPAPFDIEFQALDVSPRARKMRDSIRIARNYNWPDAIPHFLESRGVSHIADLTDPQLDDLHDRMLGYVDAAETGASLPDCLPAN